jgi:tRNA(Ile)-lysidine synthase
MSESTQHMLENRLTRAWPTSAWHDSHLVLAVSTGPDSVAMMRCVLAAKANCGGSGQVIVSHFNHGLRGAEADEEQAWLESLCRRFDVPLTIGRADATAIATASGEGREAAARDARYQFLRETAERTGARFVAVAHTADDQVETVLHRILRGTGLDGLAGMPSARPLSTCVTLVRPMLTFRRSEILEYLQAIGQDYRIDSSNSDTRWTRNRLRHELLPILRERFNGGVDNALLRLATQAHESQQVINAMVQELTCNCILTELQPGAASLRIDCRPLTGMPPLLVREVCRLAWQEAGWPMQAMGFEAWQQLAELVQGERGAAVSLPGNIRARRDLSTLVLEVRR